MRKVGIDAAGMNGEKGKPSLLGAGLCCKLIIPPGSRVRIDRRRNRRHQRHGVATERPVDERLLPPPRALQHLVANPAKRQAKVEARCRQMIEERGRKRAVRAVAVASDRAGLGGERNQRVRRRGLDLGKAAAHRTRGDTARHPLRKRVVAAGIENDEPQPFRRIYRLENPVQRDRLVLDVEIALQPGICRDQEIRAVHLDAVTGVIDHRHVGIRGNRSKVAHRPPHLGHAEIPAQLHDIETHPFEDVADGGRVVVGIGQPRDALVVGHAKDQRHPLVSQRGRRRDQHPQNR